MVHYRSTPATTVVSIPDHSNGHWNMFEILDVLFCYCQLFDVKRDILTQTFRLISIIKSATERKTLPIDTHFFHRRIHYLVLNLVATSMAASNSSTHLWEISVPKFLKVRFVAASYPLDIRYFSNLSEKKGNCFSPDYHFQY